MLFPTKIALGLDRMTALLGALGNPHLSLPPVVHIAGTNGKGSTLAFLRSMLEAAGKRVHVYTSPHLVHFNERIRIAGSLIPDDELVELLEEVEAANAGRPITFFEATTAAAFLAFARHDADFTLVECGMGGRLDATNVVPNPIVTAITSISLDHMADLGETVNLIAREKAGILRPSVPAVFGPQLNGAMTALAEEATRVGTRPFTFGTCWSVEPQENWFFYRGKQEIFLPSPPLSGAHQVVNAGMALAILDQIDGLRLKQAEYIRGVMHVKWPARLMSLRLTSYGQRRLPARVDLIVDGGHNTGAAEALARWAQTLDTKLDVVIGMLNTRDPRELIGPLVPFIRRLRGVAIEGADQSHPAAAIVAAARDVGISDAHTAPSVTDAVATLAGASNAHARRILVCGSLHLAGNVLATLKAPVAQPAE